MLRRGDCVIAKLHRSRNVFGRSPIAITERKSGMELNDGDSQTESYPPGTTSSH